MPEMVASYSSQRFSALLDFQREVDLVCPSHIGEKNAPGFLAPNQAKANHHRARYGDNTSWQQQNWSESLSALLTFQRPAAVAESPRPCAVEARATRTLLARPQGQFSAQKFIRNALKRAFARDEPVVNNVKRARLFEDFGSTAEPMADKGVRCPFCRQVIEFSSSMSFT